jgi:hypothetical protein
MSNIKFSCKHKFGIYIITDTEPIDFIDRLELHLYSLKPDIMCSGVPSPGEREERKGGMGSM